MRIFGIYSLKWSLEGWWKIGVVFLKAESVDMIVDDC